MIDFRYHLVSLISVFLALAVGIALGAGPLKEAIGDSLTGQVDQLRDDKAELRAELDARTGELATAGAAMASVAPDLLQGVLVGRRVAVIEVADVQPEVLEQVVARLTDAGATITATVQVRPAWIDPEQQTFRQTLAGTLVEYLDAVPDDEVGTSVELAEALAQGLTSGMATDPDTMSQNGALLLELLREGGLIATEGEVGGPADAVVVLAGPTVSLDEVEAATAEAASQEPADAAADAELQDAQISAALEISSAAQTRSSGAVLAGGELTESGPLSAVRSDRVLDERITTVESVHTLAGQISVPLALSARISGTVGHYGPSEDATAPMPPRVVLLPVVRVPVPDTGVADDGGAGEGPGGTGTDGATTDGPTTAPTPPAQGAGTGPGTGEGDAGPTDGSAEG